MFSKMATEIDEIFTVDLTITTYFQIEIFVVLLGNVNLKHKLWKVILGLIQNILELSKIGQTGHRWVEFW